MTLRFVTGADRHLFLDVCALLGSFAEHEPSVRLGVCDFGFTPAQAAFLDATGHRLPMPAPLARFDHPYYRKGAMVDYLAGARFGGLVWLDADMILAAPVAAALADRAAALTAAGHEVAACRDICGLDLGGFLAAMRARGHDVGHFARGLAADGTDPGHPYLNVATVLMASPAFARAWRDEVLSWPPGITFEQNAFNRLAWRRGTPGILDAGEWNLNAEMLGGPGSTTPVGRARVLHASGTAAEACVDTLVLVFPGGRLTAPFKTFTRPDLKARHVDCLSRFLKPNMRRLASCGLLEAG